MWSWGVVPQAFSRQSGEDDDPDDSGGSDARDRGMPAVPRSPLATARAASPERTLRRRGTSPRSWIGESPPPGVNEGGSVPTGYAEMHAIPEVSLLRDGEPADRASRPRKTCPRYGAMLPLGARQSRRRSMAPDSGIASRTQEDPGPGRWCRARPRVGGHTAPRRGSSNSMWSRARKRRLGGCPHGAAAARGPLGDA